MLSMAIRSLKSVSATMMWTGSSDVLWSDSNEDRNGLDFDNTVLWHLMTFLVPGTLTMASQKDPCNGMINVMAKYSQCLYHRIIERRYYSSCTYPFKTVREYFVNLYRIIMILDCRLHLEVRYYSDFINARICICI